MDPLDELEAVKEAEELVNRGPTLIAISDPRAPTYSRFTMLYLKPCLRGRCDHMIEGR